MEVLDVLNLGEIAQYFSKMAMFPVFDLAYYIVSILYLKYEPGAVEVSRKSPVASWLCAMLYCFGSYILADIILGVSPIDYFQNNTHILLASAVWYLIFFCPLNLFYKCVAFLPVKLVLVALKEVVRSRKIAAGVHHAHHAYHHGWLIMIITGYVKGKYLIPPEGWSGVALMANFEQLLRGVWKPETNEILNMSFPTKASLYGAILFTLHEAHVLPGSKSTLICLFTLFMATSKVFMTARHSHGSPFALIESWVCHLLFRSPLGGEESHDHHHSAPTAASASLSPAKTKEDLSEGTRKRKAKKAE
ncbi:Trimeric intracellular cation channel type A [Triplophysa tibetana]|uniref:Trimeric intracellular cation channel type A n=1 Tax=Triplophysa tibetana TaxID=1572043 RepID=A0A5A9ND76_9TELE|nr:Trimeric intracellular cation channel type A [Triplophysa tibetana]